MYRQRSPFAGGPGGFGASPFNFNAPQAGQGQSPMFAPASEGLNGVPFMGQSPTGKPMMHSISRQRQLAEDGLDSLPPLPIMAQRLLSSGGVVGRGQSGNGTGSYVPKTFAPYEGDASTRKDKPKLGSMARPDKSVESQNLLMSLRAGGELAAKDTDSESELCMQRGADLAAEPRWRRAFDCLWEAVPKQQRRRWETSFQRCCESSLARHLMIVLHLLCVAFSATMHMARRCEGLTGRFRFGLWRTKFQLRSTMRQMLWRLANAKANDTLVFLIVLLVTPWVFLVSLVGFAFSCVFSIKTGLSEGMHVLRMRLT